MFSFEGGSSKKKLIVVGILLSLIVVFLLLILTKKNDTMPDLTENKKTVYVIPNVPYYGLFNHFEGVVSGTINTEASILKYWNPGANPNIMEMQNIVSTSPDMAGVVAFFSQQGFSAKIEKLTIPELKKYINPQAKTPLLLFLPVTADQPATVNYHPAAILFGIDEDKQILTFHNNWLGNNFEVSFAEFNQVESELPTYQQNTYAVIQPKDLDEKLQEISQRKIENYPIRTSVMQNGEQMFKDYGVGSGAYMLKSYDIALDYFSRVEKSPQFNAYFPPYLKVGLLYNIGQIYYVKNNLDESLIYAQKAVAEDYDLDKPFKDWPGNKVSTSSVGNQDKSSSPYALLGDIYRKKNDLQNAKDNYLKALDIYPDNPSAKNGLNVLQAMEK